MSDALPSDALLEGVAKAVRADPANTDLRTHLSELLLASGRPQDALDHAVVVLGDDPSNVGALRVAAVACRRNGDTDRAKSYERLADALAPGPAPFDGTGGRSQVAGRPAAGGPRPLEGPAVNADAVPDSAEALLALWGDTPGAAEGDVDEPRAE